VGFLLIPNTFSAISRAFFRLLGFELSEGILGTGACCGLVQDQVFSGCP
jgi:hypothetical protein